MWKSPYAVLGTDEPLRVAVIGVGGTGSEVVSNLTRMHVALRAMGYAGLGVVAFDPDTVSEANIVRQRYSYADLGQNKAETLINRVNLACSLNWTAIPEVFSSSHANRTWDVVISCVDTRKARKQLHKWATGTGFHRWKFWLDLGNTNSSGQVIIGTPRGPKDRPQHLLPTATELHPEIMDTSIPDDDTPSCSAIDALQKQDLYVNTMTAVIACDMLWRLLKTDHLPDNARYFNLETGTLASRVIVPKPRRKTQEEAAAPADRKAAAKAQKSVGKPKKKADTKPRRTRKRT